MIAKKYKLPIQQVLKKKADSISGGNFFSVKIFNNSLPISRFGIVISKKVSAKATERNKIKREAFNLIQKRKSYLKGGKDFLIIVKPIVKNLSKELLKNELQKILN